MNFRSSLLAIVTGAIAVLSWLWMPPAVALTEVELYDVSFRECSNALSEGAVTSGRLSMNADCYIIFGKTKNDSGRPVINADVFGRVYDANHNNVLPNRTRLGSIDYIPTGEGEFELRITVPANMPPPLQLEQFKASGFRGKVRR